MCGVGVVLSKRHFRNFIALVVIRGLLLRMLCTFLTRGFTRIFTFLGMPKIGNWNIFYTFLDLINSMLLKDEDQDKLSRQGSLGGHQSIDLWKNVPHCVLWCIWLERNSRCFEGKERSISDFKSLLFHTLLEWRSSFNLFPCSNFLEMLDHCNLGV